MKLKSICVFCGSSMGIDPVFEQAARNLGKYMAEQNIQLVYGGAQVGLMGAVADGVLEAGGKVIGVIPTFLRTKEVAHTSLTEQIEVSSMSERKQIMFDLSDGFITMAGGFGTLDELSEILTWGQLGLHEKPLGILNTAGFFNDMIGFFNKMVEKQYVKPVHMEMLLVDSAPEKLINQMDNYKAPQIKKWITPEQT